MKGGTRAGVIPPHIEDLIQTQLRMGLVFFYLKQ